jgi:membrane protease YdiL (CAAX protease family)
MKRRKIMEKMRDFLNKNRIYVLMLVFIALFNIADLFIPAINGDNQQKEQMLKIQQAKIKERVRAREEVIIKNISQNQNLKNLAGILSFFFLFILLTGFGFLVTFFRLKIRHQEPLPRILSPPQPKWEILDAVRIAVLFVFFNYVLFLVEVILAALFNLQIKDQASRAVFNAITLDLLALGFILYFLFVKSGQRLNAIGLEIKNFLQNAFWGALGYVAFLPALLVVIFISNFIGSYFNIEPQTQPLFDLFLEEKRIAILVILTLFVVVIGPIIEEIFFRGFLYPALKKKVSAFSGMLLVSLIFASLHMNVIGFLPIFTLAFVLVYMFEKTGSLVTSIVIHCAHNGMIVLFILLARFFSGNF